MEGPWTRANKQVPTRRSFSHVQEAIHIDHLQMDASRRFVGPYKLSKTIGKGQFGKVKLAVHQETGEKVQNPKNTPLIICQVALKIIAKGKLEASTLKMVKREVMIMKLLNHPNIVRLYEVLENEEYLILVMEYASGGEVHCFRAN